MSNVVQMRNRLLRSGEAEPAAPAPSIADMVARVRSLQATARGEISRSIALLDLAAQHAREIAEQLEDPASRSAFQQHVAAIEQALEIARERATQL